MLDMGFIPDIEKICKLLPPRRQTLFFSATMPPEITRLVSQFLKDPERIEAAPPATTAKTITQLFQYCPNGEDWAKRDMLRNLISSQNVRNAIIFCNRKVEVAILHKSLVKHGFSAGALHGDMDQKARMETLDKFRAGELKLLAASDVAARGLDIPDVSHIFNFDLPWQPDDYVHRIGRTGRAGKEGVSTSLVTIDELKSLKDIEKMLGEPVTWIGESPSEEEFAEAGKKRRGRGGRTPQRGRSGKPTSQARDDKGGRGERRPAGAAPPRSGEPRQPRLEQPREPREARGEQQREPRAEQHREPREQRQPRSEQREPRAEQPREPRAEQQREHRGEERQPRERQREPRAEHAREPRSDQHRGEQRSPRTDAPREQRTDQRPPRREPRSEPHASNGEQRQPRAAQPDTRGPAQPRPAQQARPERSRERQPEGGRSGFADNVPAFLRNPVKRPAKVAGE
jgi:superfamily II DNA/RNA helicase